MKIKEISTNYSFTVNLGNYESMKFDSSITVSVNENEDYKQVYKDCWDIVNKEVNEKVTMIKNLKKKKDE